MAKEWPDSGRGDRESPEKRGAGMDRLSELVLQADLCLADGQIEEARSRLSAALAALPFGDRRRSVIRYRLGMVELEAGDFEAALDHLSEARRAYEKAGLDDRVRACHWGKAIARIGIGDWEGALRELKHLRTSYESLGEDNLAEWIGELLTALQTGLPTQKVRRIARAKPAGKGEVGEEAILERLLAKLNAFEIEGRK